MLVWERYFIHFEYYDYLYMNSILVSLVIVRNVFFSEPLLRHHVTPLLALSDRGVAQLQQLDYMPSIPMPSQQPALSLEASMAAWSEVVAFASVSDAHAVRLAFAVTEHYPGVLTEHLEFRLPLQMLSAIAYSLAGLNRTQCEHVLLVFLPAVMAGECRLVSSSASISGAHLSPSTLPERIQRAEPHQLLMHVRALTVCARFSLRHHRIIASAARAEQRGDTDQLERNRARRVHLLQLGARSSAARLAAIFHAVWMARFGADSQDSAAHHCQSSEAVAATTAAADTAHPAFDLRASLLTLLIRGACELCNELEHDSAALANVLRAFLDAAKRDVRDCAAVARMFEAIEQSLSAVQSATRRSELQELWWL
jgi:hypothetical protein